MNALDAAAQLRPTIVKYIHREGGIRKLFGTYNKMVAEGRMSAVAQLGFVMSIHDEVAKFNGISSDVVNSIIMKQQDRIESFGARAYPLSTRQMELIERIINEMMPVNDETEAAAERLVETPVVGPQPNPYRY